MLIRKLRKRKSGFTLAELLVALVILGILSLCVYLITQAASFTFSRGQEVISSDDVKDIVLEYVKQEIRNSQTVYLTDDLVNYGAVCLTKGNLLFSSEFDGYLYTLASDVDGNINLTFPQEDGRAFPANATQYFVNPSDIYGDYVVRLTFSTVTNTETGKKQSLKASVTVYKKTDTSTPAAQGFEVITLINMSQKNGEINTQYAGTDGEVRYCFYA